METTTNDTGLFEAVRRLLAQRVMHTVRFSIGSGVACLVGGTICLAIAGFILTTFGKSQAIVPALFGLGFGLYGAYNLIRGLIYLADRSPKLILGAEALI